jgi:hypothetical protein
MTDPQRFAEFSIELWALSGTDPGRDYWRAALPGLEVENIDVGADAALMGLATVVREFLAKDDAVTEPPSLRLVRRLREAERAGRLESLLLEHAVFMNYEYDQEIFGDD